MVLNFLYRQKIRTILLVIIILIVSALALQSSSITGRVIEQKAQKIILAEVLAVVSTPLFVAEEKGFWQEEGLDVEIVPFTSGKTSLDTVLAGRADMATVAETPVMFAILKESKVLIAITFSLRMIKLVKICNLSMLYSYIQ